MKPFTNLMFDTYTTHNQLESSFRVTNMDLSDYMGSCGLNCNSLEDKKEEYNKFVCDSNVVELLSAYHSKLK
jgi:hypothetical protein